MDPLEDPDYTLIVRVQDMGGVSETALSGNARVQIVVQQNLWVNPGPIIVQENLRETYPVVIAKVCTCQLSHVRIEQTFTIPTIYST